MKKLLIIGISIYSSPDFDAVTRYTLNKLIQGDTVATTTGPEVLTYSLADSLKLFFRDQISIIKTNTQSIYERILNGIRKLLTSVGE